MCAAFPLVRSLAHQRPDIGQITDDDILKLVRGHEFQQRIRGFQFTVPDNVDDADVESLRPGLSEAEAVHATSNLPVDQVALLRIMIGEQRGQALQLRVVQRGIGAQVLFPQPGASTVWIYNKVEQLGEGPLSHFEG